MMIFLAKNYSIVIFTKLRGKKEYEEVFKSSGISTS